MIGATFEPVQADARHEEAFLARAVDQHQALDGRCLAQQPHRVEDTPVAGRLRPRQLHGPAQLILDTLDEVLDLHRRQPGFSIQALAKPGALVVIAEPRLARAGKQDRPGNRQEEPAEILPEKRCALGGTWSGHGMGQPYSITRSALPSSAAGKVIPRLFAAFRLMNSSTLVTRCTARSEGFSPLRMRPA